MDERFRALLASLLFLAGITACGGGGDSPPLPPPQPVSLEIEGLPTAPMQLGDAAQLTARLTYTDSSATDVTAMAVWSTSDSAVLTVSSAGAILAIARGQASSTAMRRPQDGDSP